MTGQRVVVQQPIATSVTRVEAAELHGLFAMWRVADAGQRTRLKGAYVVRWPSGGYCCSEHGPNGFDGESLCWHAEAAIRSQREAA